MARWVLGLSEAPNFDCASDCGQQAMVRSFAALRGTRLRSTDDALYFVFSPRYRPDLEERMARNGWKTVSTLTGSVTRGCASSAGCCV